MMVVMMMAMKARRLAALEVAGRGAPTSLWYRACPVHLISSLGDRGHAPLRHVPGALGSGVPHW